MIFYQTYSLFLVCTECIDIALAAESDKFWMC